MRDPGQGLVEPQHLVKALDDFQRARAMASLQTVTARLRGKPVDLLSFDDVAQRLQMTGKASAGRQSIPLDAIVGSVGRYTDFTRTFLPRRDSDAQRWANVRVASDISGFPPIEVYRIGDAYFVLDGNHRVSIARQQSLTHIEAYVTEVRTRVPLSPRDDPDVLIVKTEHASFLAKTHLDTLRPQADVRVSAAGQYAHLENLIEVHRYFMEELERRDLDDQEAVTRWHDEAFLPVVEAIREQGILRYFPKRTETDLYVWIATHQAELRNTLGWSVAPEVAAASLAQRARPSRRFTLSGLKRWFLRFLGRTAFSVPPRDSWSREHVFARYSGQLFADVLLFLQTPVAGDGALSQALCLAQREKARLYGLYVTESGAPQAGPPSDEDLAAFHDACQQAGVQAQLTQTPGRWLDLVCDHARVADIVVINAALVRNSESLPLLVQRCPRPILLVPGAPRALERVLLYYDGTVKAREALFAATYMAEEWQAQLITLVSERDAKYQADVQAYLQLHDLTPQIRPAQSDWGGLAAAADENESDLLVLGVPNSRAGRELPLPGLNNLLKECDRPILLCT